MKNYYTIDVIDKYTDNLIGENMNEGFETLEEAKNWCNKHLPDEDVIYVINVWEGELCKEYYIYEPVI